MRTGTLALLLLLASLIAVGAATAAQETARRPVVTIRLRGAIDVPSAEYLDRALRVAEEQQAECLVILLNTPGGLGQPMKDMTEALLNAGVPTIVYVYPAGPHRDIWQWVSRGTGLYGPKKRKYPIRPKKKGGVLAFPESYTPKTTVRGPGYKGSGKSSGPTIFAKEVMHPGIKGRHFEEAWGRWAKTWFRREMENAMRRGARRA